MKSGVSKPPRMPSALTALARMPSDAGRHAAGMGGAEGEPRPAEFLPPLLGAGADNQRVLGAGVLEGARGGDPDRPGPAGDQRDLSGERLFDRAAELGLFQGPI